MTDFLNYILAIAKYLFANIYPYMEQSHIMAYTLLAFCCAIVIITFIFLLALVPYMFKAFTSMFRRFL